MDGPNQEKRKEDDIKLTKQPKKLGPIQIFKVTNCQGDEL